MYKYCVCLAGWIQYPQSQADKKLCFVTCLIRINGIKKSPIPADLSARDERYDYPTRYHSYLWTMSYTHGIRNETSSLYPLHITVDTVCTYSHRFQAAAQRRVPQFPSTASQLPAVLCAPGHVYYSLSMHLTYNFSKKILTYIGIIRQEFVSVFSVLLSTVVTVHSLSKKLSCI